MYTIIHLILFSLTDIAARHHYTNDIITAIYVNGMLWFLFEAYWPDPDVLTSYNIPEEHFQKALGPDYRNPVYVSAKPQEP